MKKRFLSLVLVVLMILAVVPVSAFAAAFEADITVDSIETDANNRILVNADKEEADTTFKVNYTISTDGSGGEYNIYWRLLKKVNGEDKNILADYVFRTNQELGSGAKVESGFDITIPAGTDVTEATNLRVILKDADNGNVDWSNNYDIEFLNIKKITLDNNGGSTSSKSGAVNEDGNYVVTAAIGKKMSYLHDGFYASQYSRTGYKFVGFSSEKSGGEVISVNALKAITVDASTPTTWYAQWEASEYTITFLDGNKNAIAGAEQKVTYGENYTLSDNVKNALSTYADSMPGYTSTWRLDDDNDGAYDGSDVEYRISDDAVEYGPYNIADNRKAIYRPIRNYYTIKFDKNGGSGEDMEPMTIGYGTKNYFPECTYTKYGYNFAGWKDKSTGEIYADKAGIPNLATENGAEVTLYAQWTPKSYEVVLHPNSAKGEITNISRECKDAKPLPSASEVNFVKDGYTFEKWTTKADGKGKEYLAGYAGTLTNTDGATVNLYAQWTPNTCTVNFNANGGEGTMAPQTYTYDEYQTLTPNAFTKTGYDFIGWALTADAAAPNYTDGHNVCNLTTVDGAEVNLYAVWEQIDYTVTLNTNGGTVNSGNVTGYTIETGATLPTDVTKAGYKFEGWYDNEALAGEAVAKIAAGTTDDKVFWAKWTSNDTDVISVVYDGDTASRENDTFKFVRDDRDLPNDGTLFIITLSDSKAKVVEGPVSEDGGLTWKFLVESESGEHKEYTIKFVIPALHKITVINGTASQDEGFIGNIIDIDADDIIGGKQFVYWEVKSEGEVVFIGGKASEITSFIMPDADVTVTAVYRAVLPMFMHSIIVVDSDYGTTSPTGIMLVMQGLSHKFTFTPDKGCEIVDVLINGESVGAVDSYRLTVNDFVNTVEAIYAPVLDGDAE